MVSTHIMAPNLLSFLFQGIWGHFLASAGTRCVHIHTQETHTIFFFECGGGELAQEQQKRGWGWVAVTTVQPRDPKSAFQI